MRDVSFGQYYPVKSPVHRIDPRVKIVGAVLYIIMLFFIPTYGAFNNGGGNLKQYALLVGAAYLIVTVFLAVIIFTSKVPLRKVLKSVKAILILIIFTTLLSLLFYNATDAHIIWQWWIIRLSYEGIASAVSMALRLIYLILGPSMLTFTTTPVQLTDGLESLLKPLSYIKLPVHELAIIMSIALRLIPTLMDETDKIMNAQKARCADFQSGNLFKRAKALLPILVPLLISSFRRAEDLSCAMDSRCYWNAKTRTHMKVLHFRFSDLICFLVCALVFVAILFLRYDFLGVAAAFFGLFGL